MFRVIKRIIILALILGVVSAGVDYTRIMTGETPIFNIREYNSNTRTETFKGFFYVFERKISASTKEKIVDSKNIKYKILKYKIDVPKQYIEKEFEFSIETKKEEVCSTSKLLYANKDIKIYTYCLEEINIIDNTTKKREALFNYLNNDYTIIEDIDSKLLFLGTVVDNKDGSTGTILKYKSDEDKFTNNGLTMYRCNKLYINDIYLAPEGTEIIGDFCKYKDDDFYFIYEIETDPLPEGVEEVKMTEVFWEDQTYRYEFDTIKKDRIYITTPGVRGRAPMKIPLMQVLQQGLFTVDALIEKGLQCNKIDKVKELEELQKQQEAQNQQNAG